MLPPTINGPVCLGLFDPDLVFSSLITITRYPADNALRLCNKNVITGHHIRRPNILFETVQIM